MVNVTTRAALAAIANPAGQVAFLMEDGREGIFEFQAGNFSAQVAADTLQGIYVASTSVAPGTGSWVRKWDGGGARPEWFGAQLGNSAYDSTPAINSALLIHGWVQLSKGVYFCARGISMPDYSVIEGAGPNHSSISISHPTDHLINCSGVANSRYLECPRGSNFAISRSVNPATPANPNNDNAQGHGIHCFMVSNPIFENVYTYNNWPKSTSATC
ncbi:hypothetical protein [Sphingobium lignivorans]|uniref:Uncharacterized protein n=1 Tax=Sphingobium lignivorans TaxID=2735886 RepID=A0ABR6NHC6_9SPHN|nr:hypothetical protein [Sphingobium lignivorans]MBB5986666.1 hypothetical protein [Sphingobium lignivorans]